MRNWAEVREGVRPLWVLLVVGYAAAMSVYLIDPYGMRFSPALCWGLFLASWGTVAYVWCHNYQQLQRPNLSFLGVFALVEVFVVVVVQAYFFACKPPRAVQQYLNLEMAVESEDLGKVQAALADNHQPDFVPSPETGCGVLQACFVKQWPLEMAVNTRRVDIVTALFDHGATLTQPHNYPGALVAEGAPSRGYGSDLLAEAAANQDIPMMRLLIAHGVPVNSKPGNSFALVQAVRCDAPDTVAFLLANGATPNSRSQRFEEEGQTVLTIAHANGYGKIAQMLKQAGATSTRK